MRKEKRVNSARRLALEVLRHDIADNPTATPRHVDAWLALVEAFRSESTPKPTN